MRAAASYLDSGTPARSLGRVFQSADIPQLILEVAGRSEPVR